MGSITSVTCILQPRRPLSRQHTYALPGLIQVVKAGDFESVLSFGVGVARAAPIHMFTLTNPSRVVIDVRTPYRTVQVRDYFLDSHRFATGQAPYTHAVYRPVIWPATAFGAMQRLFAGPTQGELASGLRFHAGVPSAPGPEKSTQWTTLPSQHT